MVNYVVVAANANGTAVLKEAFLLNVTKHGHSPVMGSKLSIVVQMLIADNGLEAQ